MSGCLVLLLSNAVLAASLSADVPICRRVTMMLSSRRPTKSLHCNGEAPQTWQGTLVLPGSM